MPGYTVNYNWDLSLPPMTSTPSPTPSPTLTPTSVPANPDVTFTGRVYYNNSPVRGAHISFSYGGYMAGAVTDEYRLLPDHISIYLGGVATL